MQQIPHTPKNQVRTSNECGAADEAIEVEYDPKVISLCAFREKRQQDEANALTEDTDLQDDQPLFELHIHPKDTQSDQYPTYFHLSERMMSLSPGGRLREMADMLEDVVSSLRSAAHAVEPDEDGPVVANVTVYASTKVKTEIHEGLQDRDWMERRLKQALEQSFGNGNGNSVPGGTGSGGRLSAS